MRVNFYGLKLEVAKISCFLKPPWRASILETRLFDAVSQLPNIINECEEERLLIHFQDEACWGKANEAMVRVLKGWQEDADTAYERRRWRWVINGDTDLYGYDITGDRMTLWAYLEVTIDRADMEQDEKEEYDLETFGLRFWPFASETQKTLF